MFRISAGLDRASPPPPHALAADWSRSAVTAQDSPRDLGRNRPARLVQQGYGQTLAGPQPATVARQGFIRLPALRSAKDCR